METLKSRDKRVVWHPYTHLQAWPEAVGITHGQGAILYGENGEEYIDAISSWWVNLHGHAHPYIAERVARQLYALEHCIFAGFTHEPAVELAEKLIEILPGNMAKIFYSDNGSTAVEVAIKMALQYWHNKGIKKTRLAVLQNAYHGDTFGAMAVSERGIFTSPFADKLFDVDVIPFPEKNNKENSIGALEKILKAGNTAALMVEPLVQGAAGMCMYSAETLEAFFQTAKKYNTLIIADEVMTGFGRTGTLFACEQISTAPDIMCLSKGLTGGTMPLGVTACQQHIFDAFVDEDKAKTLYHGHSFTANPLACISGIASLDLLLTEDSAQQRKMIAQKHLQFMRKINVHEKVESIRQQGTILALDLKANSEQGYNHPDRDTIYNFFHARGILIRPIGKTIYLIPPYCITEMQLDEIYLNIEDFLNIKTTNFHE